MHGLQPIHRLHAYKEPKTSQPNQIRWLPQLPAQERNATSRVTMPATTQAMAPMMQSVLIARAQLEKTTHNRRGCAMLSVKL